jgi:hypothetical protein
MLRRKHGNIGALPHFAQLQTAFRELALLIDHLEIPQASSPVRLK